MKERRQTEKERLKSLLRISQYAAASTQELLDYALGEAIALTDSRLGYIYFYNDQTRQFTLNTWSKGVMDVCGIMDPDTVYDLEETGIWGEAVRQARPVIVNDFHAPHPLMRGYPEGHAPLDRFMTIPVFSEGVIVAVVGLANKATDYTEVDVQQITLMMSSVWQIAERKRVEDALAQSRQMLDYVIGTLPVRIGWKDKDLKYLGCNASFAGDAGVGGPVDIIGKTDSELAWSNQASHYENQDRKLLAGGPALIGLEESYQATGKDLVWLRRHKVPLKDTRGEIIGVLTTYENTTREKQLAIELERYRDFTDNITDGCFEMDLKGNLLFVNRVVEERLGHVPDGLIGVNNRAFSSPEEARRISKIFNQVYQTGQPATIENHSIFDNQGEARSIDVSVSLIRDAKGCPTGFRGTTRDMTERKRIQDTLAASEARYRRIFQDNKAVMLLIDVETGAIMEANDAACLYYGYSRPQLLERTLSQIDISEKEILEEMSKACLQDRSHHFFQHRLSNGEVRPVEVFSSPIAVGDKQILFAIIHDIKARVEAETALKESEEKYRQILTSIHDGYFEIDLNGNFTFANEAAIEILGYDIDEILNMNYRQIAAPETAQRMKETNNWTYRTGVASSLLNYEIIRKDGSIRVQEMNTGLIRDADGRPQGFHVMARDITENIKAEEALRQSEERIRLLFNNIPVPTFVWKVIQGRLILSEYNGAAFQFIGEDIAEFVGKTADQFFNRMPQIPGDIRKCLALRKTVENQFWYGGRDDRREKRYVIVKYAFAPPDSVLMHVNDITGQKRAEENLQYISIHDSLTGLYNRFYADAEIERLTGSRLRPVSVIIIDLNGLKVVNDERGHAMGDLYIKNAAAILKQTFRPEDMIARIGGDEFLILLPHMDEIACAQTLKRLNEHLDEFNLNNQQPLSLSAGAATAHLGDSLVTRIREADRRMYQDKAACKASRPLSRTH